jgi:phosphopantothenoylcysteine decarboxylase
MPAPVLYHVVCAAEPAVDAAAFVRQAQQRDWDVCLIATPAAARWLDLPALETATGHPVRTGYKLPGEPDVLPPPDAIAVVPATFNTVNKWAAGIADTLVLGLLTEAVGMDVSIVAVPWINAAQARHPAFDRSVGVLRAVGVTVVEPPAPAAGPGGADPAATTSPWRRALDALETSSAD